MRTQLYKLARYTTTVLWCLLLPVLACMSPTLLAEGMEEEMGVRT